MNVELLIAIAQLCHAVGWGAAVTVKNVTLAEGGMLGETMQEAQATQLKCQQEYIKCLRTKTNGKNMLTTYLADCVLEKGK